MGCSNEKPGPQGTLLEQYHAANLPQPWSGEYENDFEKQIYMAINLCRHDAKRFVPHVRKVYKEHVLLRAGAGKRMNDLIAKLQAAPSMSPCRFEPQANEACKQNNADIIAKDEAAPALGGNIAKFTELSGSDKTGSCHEYTMVKFEGTTGEEFIALQMALDFEDFEGAKKPLAGETVEQPAAEIQAAEEPAAAAANGLDTEQVVVAGDKSTGEEAKEVKKDVKKDAKKPAAIIGYTPVLDEAVEQVGVSNKAHKKTVNVIQVLYCKTAGNAMM